MEMLFVYIVILFCGWATFSLIQLGWRTYKQRKKIKQNGQKEKTTRA